MTKGFAYQVQTNRMGPWQVMSRHNSLKQANETLSRAQQGWGDARLVAQGDTRFIHD